MNIAIIGSGYVGLVVGACFADAGNTVICADIDSEKIAALRNGNIPIYERGLSPLVQKNMQQHRLSFTSDIPTAIKQSAVIFIAVGTPQNDDGSCDLSFVINVAENIGKSINSYKVIVNKSTVPIGTADKVSEEIQKHTTQEFDVVSNPEFLKEGSAVDDFLKPDRVVIGSTSTKAIALLKQLYAPFTRSDERMYIMSARSAEMTKYAANAMLATRIIFMNDVADLCDAAGADVTDVRKGVGSDSRIGKAFLYPGLGYGGSCFPKDTKALVKTGDQFGVNMAVVKAVIAQNDLHKQSMVKKIQEHYNNNLSGKHFALWGLAFKNKTDDIRESAAITTAKALLEHGASVAVYDPEALENTKNELQDTVTYCNSAYDALAHADALIICTDWKEFTTPNFTLVHSLLKTPVIFDGRNLYHPRTMKECGFTYYSKGRPTE